MHCIDATYCPTLHGLSVCLSVCRCVCVFGTWVTGLAVQKRLNRSRYCLGNYVLDVDRHLPREEAILGLSGH